MSNSEPHKNSNVTHGPITSPGKLPEEIESVVEDEQSHEGHGGMMQYMAVFVALCFLTTMSFLTYSSYWPWRDEPQVGWAFMMAVSCTKALLVVLFFYACIMGGELEIRTHNPCSYDGHLPRYHADTRHWLAESYGFPGTCSPHGPWFRCFAVREGCICCVIR